MLEGEKRPVWPLISAIAKRVRGGGPRAAGRFVLPEPTFAGIADALRASRSEKDSLKLQKWAGGIITPLEAAELKEGSHRFPPPTQAWLSRLAALGEFATVPPQRYRRQALVPNIDIYSDASIPSERKSLILGFSGAAGQLMIPTPVFLQYVSSERYDVVVLRDRTKQGYAIGIPPYAHNLWDLAQKLTAEIGAATYRRVYPYGTSMGGFPALRCGLLLQDRNGRLRRRPVPVVSAPSRPEHRYPSLRSALRLQREIQDQAHLLSQHRSRPGRPERRHASAHPADRAGAGRSPRARFSRPAMERGTAAGVLRPDLRRRLRASAGRARQPN